MRCWKKWRWTGALSPSRDGSYWPGRAGGRCRRSPAEAQVPSLGHSTRHGGNKSAAQVFLTAPAPMQCCLLTISRSFLKSLIFDWNLCFYNWLDPILRINSERLNLYQRVESYYALRSWSNIRLRRVSSRYTLPPCWPTDHWNWHEQSVGG